MLVIWKYTFWRVKIHGFMHCLACYLRFISHGHCSYIQRSRWHPIRYLDARIAGVSYDAEVWTNSEYNWKNNDSTRYQQIQFIKTAQQYADSKKLSVSYCLPFWITRYNYTDADGTTKNIYDSITQISNNTILMAYRDSASAVEKLVAQVQNGAEK